MKSNYWSFIIVLACLTPACRALPRTADALKSEDQLVQNENLCVIARDKKAHLGEEATLAGTFVTDFRHYSLFKAKCDAGEAALSVGVISPNAKNVAIKKAWWEKYCGSDKPSCDTRIPLMLRGKLVKRDDGFEFDVIEIIEAGMDNN